MFGLSDIAVKLILAGVGAAALMGLIGGGIHHIQQQAREKAVIEQNARIMEQAKKDAEEVAKQKAQEAADARKRESAALARVAAGNKQLAKYRDDLRRLQLRDPAVREWAATPVPASVVACVLGLADCAAGSDQSNGTPAAAVSAPAADDGADLAIKPDERGSGRVWSGLRYRPEGVQRGQGGHPLLGAEATAERDHRSGGSKAATGAAVVQ